MPERGQHKPELHKPRANHGPAHLLPDPVQVPCLSRVLSGALLLPHGLAWGRWAWQQSLVTLLAYYGRTGGQGRSPVPGSLGVGRRHRKRPSGGQAEAEGAHSHHRIHNTGEPESKQFISQFWGSPWAPPHLHTTSIEKSKFAHRNDLWELGGLSGGVAEVCGGQSRMEHPSPGTWVFLAGRVGIPFLYSLPLGKRAEWGSRTSRRPWGALAGLWG